MKSISFSELGDDVRASLQGHRWLVLKAIELPRATAALAFSELEDVLVAVDETVACRRHAVIAAL